MVVWGRVRGVSPGNAGGKGLQADQAVGPPGCRRRRGAEFSGASRGLKYRVVWYIPHWYSRVLDVCHGWQLQLGVPAVGGLRESL